MSERSRESVENGPAESPRHFLYTGAVEAPRSVSGRADPAQAHASQLSEAAFREAIENAVGCGLFVCDVDGHQTYVSPCFCKMIGWLEEELVGARPPYVYWPENEIDRVQEAFDEMLAGNAPDDGFELRFARKSGEIFDAHVAVSPLISRDGLTQGWLASVTDITDRKRIETELRIREQQLRFALGAASVGMWDWNLASDKVHWSENMESLHGLREDASTSGLSSLFETIRADHRECVKREILRARDGGDEYHVEYPLEPRDGETRWIEAFGSTLCDDDGAPARLAGICLDISDRMKDGATNEDAVMPSATVPTSIGS